MHVFHTHVPTQEDNARLKERYESMAQKLKASVQEANKYKNSLMDAENRRSDQPVQVGEVSAEEHSMLKAEHKEMTSRVAALEKELEGKMRVSKQFQQVKKMLLDKNNLVRDLRAELAEKS